jgi:hypothetical protein
VGILNIVALSEIKVGFNLFIGNPHDFKPYKYYYTKITITLCGGRGNE